MTSGCMTVINSSLDCLDWTDTGQSKEVNKELSSTSCAAGQDMELKHIHAKLNFLPAQPTQTKTVVKCIYIIIM